MTPRRKPAATRLDESFFRALIEQTSDLVCVLRPDGTVLYASPSYEAVLGYNPESLIGRNSFDFVHPEDVAAVAESFKEVMAQPGLRASSGEYRMRHADGSWHTLVSLGTNLVDDPLVNGVLVNARDLTEYRQTRDLLARSRELAASQLAELEQLYQSAPVGMALLDCELRYLRINNQLAQMNGLLPQAHLGRTIREVIGDVAIPLEPLLRGVIATGVPIVDLESQGEAPLDPGVARDWVSSYYRLDDAKGVTIGVIVTVQEITERRRIERSLERGREELELRVRERTAELQWANDALRAQIEERRRAEELLTQSELRYRHLVENITEVIFALDRGGRITYISPAIERLSGHTPAELVGRPSLELIHPEDGAKLMASYCRTLSGFPEPSEYRVRTSSGDWRWVRSHSLPIFAEGRVVGTQGVLSDITQRRTDEMQTRRRQAEMAHAQRLTTAGEMTAEIAHQINQPLAAITNYASGLAVRLRDGRVDTGLVSEIATRISTEALRAGDIIRQLRAFLRKGESVLTTCDMNQLVAYVFRLLEEDFRRESIEVCLELEASLPALQLNTILIEQVVLNLLRNALEAMSGSDGPRQIDLRTEVVDHTARVTVRDSGSGLPPGAELQVFEPFFTTKPDGLGLGLSVSRSIIDGSGGSLWIERNHDRGTTVRFSLPLQRNV